jgi:hypothetical protein
MAGNHSGVPVFELCLLSLVAQSALVVSRYRLSMLNKVDLCLWFCGLAAGLISGVLDRCNFLVEYDSWAHRGLPDPDLACCAVLAWTKACTIAALKSK